MKIFILEISTLIVFLIFSPAMFLAGRNFGWSKGYRQGKELNGPLVAALENALEQERGLTAALTKQTESLNRNVDAQAECISLKDKQIAAQRTVVDALHQQIDLLNTATESRKKTIEAQRQTIELFAMASQPIGQRCEG